MKITRLQALAAVVSPWFVSRLAAQTKMKSTQLAMPPQPGPSILVVMADGTHRQVIVGTGLTLLNNSGAWTLNATPSAARPPHQRLLLEADRLSWRIPLPVGQNSAIYRNGMRLLLGLDYEQTGDNLIRPTTAQGTEENDIWTAE